MCLSTKTNWEILKLKATLSFVCVRTYKRLICTAMTCKLYALCDYSSGGRLVFLGTKHSIQGGRRAPK